MTAFLPAPHSTAADLLLGSAAIYADSDCTGVSPEYSLSDFIRDRNSGGFDRVVLELANHAYCARTLPFAASGVVDIVLRDRNFGVALQALAQCAEGRALVVFMLYSAGGYHAVRAALDGGFTHQILGKLVTPGGLNALGRTQILPLQPHFCGAMPSGWAWREDIRGAIAELIDAEQSAPATALDWSRTATALSANMATPASAQWLVDISNLAVRDAGTGIQRVVRHVLDELISSPPAGYRVEPVCLGDDGVFRYARRYCARRYFSGEEFPPDEPVEFAQGDVYLGLDLVAHLIPAYISVFRRMRNRGVRQHFVLYDLLPVLRPDCFEPHLLPLFRSWYEAVAEVADGIICISRAVADEFESWLHQARPERQRPLGIGWFHLGADLAGAGSTHVALAPRGPRPLDELGDRPTFLMVGTIEPRKGHAQALAAFEQLWQKGVQANLLVIGKPGWLVDDLLCHMADHPQRGKQLFWFEQAGDDTLLAAYHRASALLMASEGEGFGLPLIEAAHHGLALIARDLAVFREIAGEHAHYFKGYEAVDLSNALQDWLEFDALGRAPQSSGMRWKTWKEATAQLIDIVCNESWVHRWMPAPTRHFNAFDYRFHTQVGRLDRGRMTATGEAGLLLYGPYVSLNAGRYSVLIQGGGSGVASMDVCSAGGASIHAHQDFVADHVQAGSALVRVELKLDEDVTDLEIRVRVEAGSDLWLDRVEIHPILTSVAAANRSAATGSVVA